METGSVNDLEDIDVEAESIPLDKSVEQPIDDHQRYEALPSMRLRFAHSTNGFRTLEVDVGVSAETSSIARSQMEYLLEKVISLRIQEPDAPKERTTQ